ncbi:hypothetical protein F4777DRAFT_599817 [Nemania sp. FL0916]|nr:hypothetical protein F4777DRAFT_599817 [Nemania sp. FL0916]
MADQEMIIKPNSFFIFNMLPTELRLMIWKGATLEVMDRRELLILDNNTYPQLFERGGYHPLPPVNIGFPNTMHVNRESRYVALKHLQFDILPPNLWGKCPVPQRAFRPDIDTLYYDPLINYNVPFLHADPQVCNEERMKIQHLAFPIDDHIIYFGVPHMLRLLIPKFPALRTVCAVLGPICQKTPVISERLYLPQRRYRLRYIKIETIGRLKAILRSSEANFNEREISFNLSVFTEWCYSPSGDSRFVAAGEKFPDSPDPSMFALENTHGVIVHDYLADEL